MAEASIYRGTTELMNRVLDIQKINRKCRLNAGSIGGAVYARGHNPRHTIYIPQNI